MIQVAISSSWIVIGLAGSVYCSMLEWKSLVGGVSILSRSSLVTIAGIIFSISVVLLSWGMLNLKNWGYTGIGIASGIAGLYSLSCILMAGLELGTIMFSVWSIVLILALVTVVFVIMRKSAV